MKLKPCPFCGSENLRRATPGQRYIECLNCGVYGPDHFDKMNYTQWTIVEANLVDLWNERQLEYWKPNYFKGESK